MKGRCRLAGSCRLPQIRTGRTSIDEKKKRRLSPVIKEFEDGVSRVNEKQACSNSPKLPPQRVWLRIMPDSLFVVAAVLCILLDPRDPQQVIIAQGLPPHPGPEQGAVMQEVEIIEEKLQRQAEQKPESSRK